MVIKDANVVNLFDRTVERRDVLTEGDIIKLISVDIPVNGNDDVISAEGAYLIPGFIDSHIHIESSHLLPSRFGAALLAHGTTTAVCDPHEIVNVAGEAGLVFMLEEAEKSPCDLLFMLPSCVPSTDMETSGAVITAADTERIFSEYPQLLGLGEMMNFPGVLAKDSEVMRKIAVARSLGKPIDGHFPLGSGESLKQYIAAGINSDHETVTEPEAKEKIALGMDVFIREGGSAKNLHSIIGAVSEENAKSFCFCADDASASYLDENGDIICSLRKAVAYGTDPLTAIEIATLSPARHYNLIGRGAVAEGYKADLILVNNLTDFEIRDIIKDGTRFNAEIDFGLVSCQAEILNSVILPENFSLSFPEPPDTASMARVIELFPDELFTKALVVPVAESDNEEIAKAAVVSRYGNGNISYGYVKGTGLKYGAIAQSIGHDSHNITVVGKDIADMELAVKRVGEMQGGVSVVSDGAVIAEFAMPYGGLMCDLSVKDAAVKETRITEAIRKLGVTLPSPIITISFISLPVIPELKLTDRGLIDVLKFNFTELYC